MKRLIVVLGIAFVIIGLGLVSGYNAPEEVESNQFVTAEKSWTISDTFQQGQKLRLEVQPHSDWRLPPYFPEEIEGIQHSKLLQVNISNTDLNTYTLFEVIYGFPPGYIPEPPYMVPIYAVAAGVAHYDGINVEDPTEIGGIVQDDGVYTVNCYLIPDNVLDTDLQGNPWPHPTTPPSLILHKISSETTYPYTYRLPLGISLGIVGITTLFWGIKSRKQKTIRKSRLR